MTKAFLRTEADVDAYQAVTAATVVVGDRFGGLYLIYWGVDEWLCYQGVPEALNERGTRVDVNRGRVVDLLRDRGPLVRIWPGA